MMYICTDCSNATDTWKANPNASSMATNNGKQRSRRVAAKQVLSTQAESPSTGTDQSTESPSEITVFDPVLCYLASARDRSKKIDTIHLASAYFADSLIIRAKTKLWESSPAGIIGDFVNRKNTDGRSSKEAHVQDILDAMNKLDDMERIPTFAVKSDELYLLPKTSPNELLEYSVTERVSSVEEKLRRLAEAVDLII
jgi:hypothetical protein